MGLRLLLGLLLVATTARAAAPPADPFCGLATDACATPYVLVMTAFPAETSAVLQRPTMTATDTVVDGPHTFYVGRLGGAPVVVMRTGIGMLNAAAATEAALARFAVGSVLFSGVAGSDENIADVVIPDDWSDGQGVYPVDADLLAAARPLVVTLEDCAQVPPEAPTQEVCMAHVPRIVVGGNGESSDPFGPNPLRCTAGGGAVFGCDDAIRPAAVAQGGAPFPDAVDQETAAVARIATRAGIPFLGVRGVSDGGGDPLGLPGFPSQFFAYYVISAENAARVVEAVLDAVTPDDVPEGLVPGAACNWARAATPACDGVALPPGITRRVDTACGLLTQPLVSRTAARLRTTWRRTARTVARTKKLPRDCRTGLADALRARGAVSPAAP
jgi:nucleoside phosphorylase